MIGTGFKLPLSDCNYESYEAISLENTRLYTQLNAKSAKPRHRLTRIQSQTPEAYLGSYASHSFKENSLPSHPHKIKPSKSSAIKYTLRKLDYKSYFTNRKPLEDTLRQEALRINTKDVNRPISRPKSAATRTGKEAKELISIEDEYLRKQIVLTNNITFKPLSNASKLKTLKYIENNGNKAIELLKKRELLRKKNYGEPNMVLTRPPRSISNSSRANEPLRNSQTPLRSDILTVTRCPTSTRSRSLTNSRRAERVISTSETQTNLSIEAPVSSCSISRNFSISEGESQEEESPTYNLRRCYA